MNGTVFAETVRRHVTSIGYGAYLAFLAIVALGVSRFNAVGAGWPTLISLLAIITGAALIGPEFSSGTLQLILAKPVNRSVYLLSRVAGVVTIVWIAAAVAFLAESAGHLMFADGPVRWRTLVAVLINAGAAAVLTCSLLALFGSVTRAYFNVAIYVVAQIGLSITSGVLGMIRVSGNAIGRFLSAYPIVEKSVAAIDRNLFPDVAPAISRDWLLLVLSNAAIALVLACFAFRSREVPYGAD